ncbi:MAG: hypothetical protein RL220_2118 [Bacteroidota bacterium]|jgi:hypothetical protein
MIQEASIGGVIKIIFYILVVSAVIRFVAYLATPYVVRRAEEELKSRMRQNQPPRKEGEVTIQPNSKSSGKADDRGEYVDFEEVK